VTTFIWMIDLDAAEPRARQLLAGNTRRDTVDGEALANRGVPPGTSSWT